MDISKKIDIKGEKAWMRKMVGKVRDARQWQETWVSGNYSSGYTQHRSNKQKFWIVGDGFEQEIHSTTPVREGHEVSVVWVDKNGSSGRLAVVYNKTTDDYAWHLNPFGMAKKLFPIIIFCLLIALVVGVTAASTTSLSESDIFILCMIPLAFIPFLIIRSISVYSFWNKLTNQALIFARE